MLPNLLLDFYYFKGRFPLTLTILPPYFVYLTHRSVVSPHSATRVYSFVKLYLLKTIRFSFSGKGYRIYFDRRAFTFTFGHSHLFYVYFFNADFTLTAKTRGFISGLNAFNLKTLRTSLFLTKPLNIFTWRGVRFRGSWIAKKAGKISMYR